MLVIRFPLLICAFSCAACTSAEFLHIDSKTINSETVFFVRLFTESGNLQIINEIGRNPGLIDSKPLVRFSLEKSEESIHMMSLRNGTLSQLISNYDATRSQELQLRFKDAESISAIDFRTIELPATLDYSVLDVKTGNFLPAAPENISKFRQELELLVPLDLDACRNPDRETLNVFYEPPSSCSHPCTGLHDVDDDRFIGVTEKGIQVFSRTQVNDCGTVSSSTSAGARGSRIMLPKLEDNFAVGATPLPDGSYLVVTALNERVDNEPVAYHITERYLYEDGFGPITHTKTLVPEDFPNLTSARKIFVSDVAIDDKNTAYVVFTKGTIFSRDREDRDYEANVVSNFASNPKDKYFLHLATRLNSDAPHLLSTEGVMYLGNLRQDQWNKINLAPLEQVLTPWESVFSHRPNLSEIYFAGNDGAQGWLGKINGNTPEEIKILHPERLAPCMPKGRFTRIRRLLLDDNALYALPDCNTIVRIRHEDQCSSFINFETNPEYQLGDGELRGIILRNEQLLLAGREAKIYSFNLLNFDRDLNLAK